MTGNGTAVVLRESPKKVFGVFSGWRIEDEETWWWNEEVQENIPRNRLAKKKWDIGEIRKWTAALGGKREVKKGKGKGLY